MAIIKGTLLQDLCTFMVMSDGILLRIIIRIRNVSDEKCRENQSKFIEVFFSKMEPFVTKCGKT